MLCIVVNHGIEHGSGLNYELIYSWGSGIGTFLHLAIFSFGKVGITGFMFISGYYGIKFKKRNFFTLLATCAFYLLILSRGSDWLMLVKPYSRWWFIESYLLVYLLSPAVELMFSHLDRSKLSFIVLALAYYSYVGRFISYDDTHGTIMLLTIYIIARYIGIYVNGDDGLHKSKASTHLYQFIMSRTGLIILMISVGFIPVLMNIVGLPFRFFELWFQNNNILYLVLAGAMVISSDKKPFYDKTVNWLSESVLAIYLITDSRQLRHPVDSWLYGEIMDYRGYLFAIIICISCILVDKVRDVLFKQIEKAFHIIVAKFKKSSRDGTP